VTSLEIASQLREAAHRLNEAFREEASDMSLLACRDDCLKMATEIEADYLTTDQKKIAQVIERACDSEQV